MKLTTGQNEVVLITRDGMSIRFNEEDVRSMGRPAAGVRGINLERPTQSSRWPSSCRTRRCWSPAKTASASAPISSEYRRPIPRRQGHHHHEDHREDRQRRRRADRPATPTKSCSSPSAARWCARRVNDIREAGRNTQGVKLIDLDAGDKLQAIAPVISEDKEDAASEAGPEK